MLLLLLIFYTYKSENLPCQQAYESTSQNVFKIKFVRQHWAYFFDDDDDDDDNKDGKRR